MAVIGPNADVIYNYLGDYTAPQERSKVVTLLDAVRERLPKAMVYYEKGCAIRDTTTSNIQAAVEAAKKADVVIVAVGFLLKETKWFLIWNVEKVSTALH